MIMQDFMKKKIIFGASDAWSTIHLSHRPGKPAYHIVDCRILVCTWGYQDRPYPIVYSWSKRSREHGKPFWLSSRNQLSNPTSRAVTIYEGGPFPSRAHAGCFKKLLKCLNNSSRRNQLSNPTSRNVTLHEGGPFCPKYWPDRRVKSGTDSCF